MKLQGTGHDFCGTRRVPIDQHGHGKIEGKHRGVIGVQFHVFRIVGAIGAGPTFGIGDQRLLRQEQIAYFAAGTQQTAWIPAEIQHEGFHALFLKLDDALPHVLRRVVFEISNTNIADITGKYAGFLDALQWHFGPFDHKVHILERTTKTAGYRNLHRSPPLPTDAIGDCIYNLECGIVFVRFPHTGGRFVIDGNYDISSEQSGFGRRCPFDGHVDDHLFALFAN